MLPAAKKYLESLQARRSAEEAEQNARFTQSKAALRQAIDLFGDDYGAGIRSKALASSGAALAKAGLSGTTRGAALSAGLEAEIEDRRRRGRSAGLTNLASFLGSYNDPYAVKPLEAAQMGLAQRQFGAQERKTRLASDMLRRGSNQETAQYAAPPQSYGRDDSIWYEPLLRNTRFSPGIKAGPERAPISWAPRTTLGATPDFNAAMSGINRIDLRALGLD